MSFAEDYIKNKNQKWESAFDDLLDLLKSESTFNLAHQILTFSAQYGLERLEILNVFKTMETYGLIVFHKESVNITEKGRTTSCLKELREDNERREKEIKNRELLQDKLLQLNIENVKMSNKLKWWSFGLAILGVVLSMLAIIFK